MSSVDCRKTVPTANGFTATSTGTVQSSHTRGGHAVVASVWEDWTVPVDVAVKPFAVGTVFRQSTR